MKNLWEILVYESRQIKTDGGASLVFFNDFFNSQVVTNSITLYVFHFIKRKSNPNLSSQENLLYSPTPMISIEQLLIELCHYFSQKLF